MSSKPSDTLFAHIPEVEYKRLMEVEHKYYDLLAEREDISEYRDALEKLRVGEIIVDTRYLKDKKVGFHSIDSWDKINIFTRILVGEDALKKSLERLYKLGSEHRIIQDYNF